MTKTHSASCLGYICTCDNCYRCEGIIKDLRAENLENWNRAEILQAENARYREALKIVAEGEAHPLRFYQIRDLAREALKGGE